MSLNIKNERVHDLAREAARRSGESQTRVIELALLHYLSSLPDSSTLARRRVDLVLADVDFRLAGSADAGIGVEELYDEVGLPR
jgi:antitoxin VapB